MEKNKLQLEHNVSSVKYAEPFILFVIAVYPTFKTKNPTTVSAAKRYFSFFLSCVTDATYCRGYERGYGDEIRFNI